MSRGEAGCKHDKGNELQMQVGIDLMELEKFYSADIINSCPEDVKKKVGVKHISKKGTTSRNRELKLEQVKNENEKKKK